jgi:catechol 2,3-dioxygenase-like lactoylglutathione lyase family enzyme
MAQTATSTAERAKAFGPPKLKSFDHVSLPCRDLDEAIRFYRDVLGGELKVKEGAFALFHIAGTRIGVSSAGCTFMTRGAEYPHVAFVAEADQLVQMKEWLAACGVPSSNFWTRQGVETLMFFRDPSGNVIELFCHGGYAGAKDLPRGPAQGHGTSLDIDSISYTTWKLPGAPA